jgi:hypothetical protein
VNVTEGSNLRYLGQMYELQCNVAPHLTSSAGYTVSFQWKKNNNSESPLDEREQQLLSFNPLRLSNAGEYTCVVIIESEYLNGAFSIPSNNKYIINLTS